MPDAVVAPAPKPELDFGIPDIPEVIPQDGGEGRSRDERGRFVAVVAETPEAPLGPEGVESPEPAVAADIEMPAAGLELGDDVPPTFDHDGRFVGGKYLGKYDTLDDALVGFKSARRELTRLQAENNRLRANGDVPGDPPPYVFDPHSMTEDQLIRKVAQEMGGTGELSYEERVKYEENPILYNATLLVKGQKAMAGITETSKAWEEATRAGYLADELDEKGVVIRRGMAPELFDRARPLGGIVYHEFTHGYIDPVDGRRKHIGPAEIQVLLGLGKMVRDGKLSDDQPVIRHKSVGRAPETRAAVPVRSPERKADPRAEQKRELAEMQHAAYGS